MSDEGLSSSRIRLPEDLGVDSLRSALDASLRVVAEDLHELVLGSRFRCDLLSVELSRPAVGRSQRGSGRPGRVDPQVLFKHLLRHSQCGGRKALPPGGEILNLIEDGLRVRHELVHYDVDDHFAFASKGLETLRSLSGRANLPCAVALDAARRRLRDLRSGRYVSRSQDVAALRAERDALARQLLVRSEEAERLSSRVEEQTRLITNAKRQITAKESVIKKLQTEVTHGGTAADAASARLERVLQDLDVERGRYARASEQLDQLRSAQQAAGMEQQRDATLINEHRSTPQTHAHDAEVSGRTITHIQEQVAVARVTFDGLYAQLSCSVDNLRHARSRCAGDAPPNLVAMLDKAINGSEEQLNELRLLERDVVDDIVTAEPGECDNLDELLERLTQLAEKVAGTVDATAAVGAHVEARRPVKPTTPAIKVQHPQSTETRRPGALAPTSGDRAARVTHRPAPRRSPESFNRALAAALRSAGEEPKGQAWLQAKADPRRYGVDPEAFK